MQHGKVGYLLILNGYRHLVRDIEDRLFPGHGEEAFCLLKSLELREIILMDKYTSLEVRHEDTSAFQE